MFFTIIRTFKRFSLIALLALKTLITFPPIRRNNFNQLSEFDGDRTICYGKLELALGFVEMLLRVWRTPFNSKWRYVGGTWMDGYCSLCMIRFFGLQFYRPGVILPLKQRHGESDCSGVKNVYGEIKNGIELLLFPLTSFDFISGPWWTKENSSKMSER